MNRKNRICVVGARQHNLKNISVPIPRGALTVITGPSGSGKSSLAFDTIFAEGQRKYVESLSARARQFLEQLPRPDVERIEGLTPTIAVEQRVAAVSPRSTVATATEIHDFLRVLFARLGEPRCWVCDRPIVRQSIAQIVDSVLNLPRDRRVMILGPLAQVQGEPTVSVLARIQQEGFVRARINGSVVSLEDTPQNGYSTSGTIDVVVDRLTVKPDIARRLADGVEQAGRLSAGRVIIAVESAPGVWTDTMFSTVLTCPEHPDVRMDDLSPALFSFNAPQGACMSCHGLGTTSDFDPDLIVPDQARSLSDGAIAAARGLGPRHRNRLQQVLETACRTLEVSTSVPFRELPEPARRAVIFGGAQAESGKRRNKPRPDVEVEGVLPFLRQLWSTTSSAGLRQRLQAFLSESPCPSCKGARLGLRALSVKVADRNIAEITRMTIRQAAPWFDAVTFPAAQAPIAEPILGEIRRRLRFLKDAGLDYLTLDRSAASLSGGEWQRIRLATQIGGGLSGICYVLDEPTIGLHARDSRRLTEILRRLASLDNTVIVVEHDEEVIRGADHVIEIGPGAAAAGGYVVAQGNIEEILAHGESHTARYLTGRSSISVRAPRRSPDWSKCVELRGVTAHNLKDISVRFPLGCFVCVAGVSGSGKSTLVHHVLLRALRRRLYGGGPRPGAFRELVGGDNVHHVIEVDQSPIARTPRGNPATYVGVFSLIRELFARTREAKVRGYGPDRFSFNVAGGRCEHCQGQGVRRVAMHFMPDVFVTCSECGGTRYNRETREVRYRGASIADVLAMTVDDAGRFFENIPNIARRVRVLAEVGLGYLTLGQASNTLSGGEAQRVKLAAELHREPEGHTLYLLDEPTTGLHFVDISNLLAVLHRLVDRGQTVVCIEHQLDLIRSADWIIDLGPEGGDAGGEIVAEGPPEAVAACARSHTGRFLAQQ